MEDKVTLGAILSRSFALAGSMPAAAAFAAVLLPWVAAGFWGETADLALILIVLAVVVSFAAQYMLTSTLLRRSGVRLADRRGRARSFVGASIVTGLGIALGYILLILPGLYLLARWSIVTPLIVGEGLSMDDSMRESGVRTDRSIVPIAFAFVLIFLPETALTAYWMVQPGLEVAAPIERASDVLTAATSVVAWCCCVAVYDLTRPRS